MRFRLADNPDNVTDLAEWSAAQVNDLPDSSFLYVEPGEKDSEGKTTPRSKRHFPYKSSSGAIDLPHLRNAIARIPQSNAPGLDKDKVQKHAQALLAKQSAGEIDGRRFHLDEPQNIAKIPTDPAEAAKPKWNMLFPMGGERFRQDFPGGKVLLDRDFLGTMLLNFKKLQERYKGKAGDFGLPITYFHPDTSDDEVPPEHKLAGGWIIDLELRDDGLYALEKWNDDAKALINGDRIRYQSPEFAFAWQDSSTGENQGPTLFGSSLLNNPFLKDMPRVAASDTPPAAAPESTAMSDKSTTFRQQIAAALGLNADATDDNIMAAFGKTKGAHKALRQKLAAAYGHDKDGDDDGDDDDFIKKVKAWALPKAGPSTGDGDPDKARGMADMNAKLTLVESQNETLKSQLAEVQRKLAATDQAEKTKAAMACVDALQKSGKIIATQREKILKLAEQQGVAYVEEFFKDAPSIVPMGEHGVAGETQENGMDIPSVQLRFNAKVDELVKAGEAYPSALKHAQQLMPKESKLLYAAAANGARPTVES